MDIKIECERIFTLCQGCLSADRKFGRITDQNKALFFKLRDDVACRNETKDLLLCWECIALLNKMKSFQSRIKTAQYRLMQYIQTFSHKDNIPHTLSALKLKETTQYDHEFIYTEEQTKPHEEKQETVAIENEAFITEIKLETNEQIKEEYDNGNDLDTDFYEPELKIENEILDIVNHKQKKEMRKLSIKVYEKYATITQKNDTFKKVGPHSQTVFLTETEVEEILNRDRKAFGYNRLPFKCKECELGYKRKLDLLRHKSFHHRKSQFPTSCVACEKQIDSETDLKDHWKDYHTPMLRCTLCSELCRSKGEMRKHLNRTHTKLYTCNECRQEFRTLREFSGHYKTIHERVVCDYCNNSFTSKRRLESHIKRNHLPAYCSVCNRTYRTYHVFENHVRTYHPELLSCDTRKEMCYCVECDKQYPSIYKYRRHLQQSARHTPRKKIRVPCPECNKIFTRTAYMNNHYRLVHMKDTKHYCDLCNKYFATGYGVRKHIQFVHQKMSLPKDKICDLCGRGFSTNRILTNHRRTHTGERPYKCKYCPATFAQDTAMKTHQKTQHKNVVNIQMPLVNTDIV